MSRRVPPPANGSSGFDETLRAARSEATSHRQTFQVRVVTPILGGGYETGQADMTNPISAKGIRGQLRFWWRMLRGGEFSDVREMALWESAIFGSTDVPAPFDIGIANVSFP